MDAVEEVKARLSIEDVISEYVQLKRAGRNWKGLSPFTSERTPSFMVSPEKQIWHDFSSGKGGDMFSFVMEMEGLDFKGALELLARKAGIDLEQYRHQGARRGPNKERLYELLELSTKFYQVQFSKSRTALAYVLGKRQFSKETALRWRLGYSPNTGTALIDFLQSKGFSEAEMQQAGVTAQRSRGLGDMFRGRLMIPLADPQGRVIGFTARLLADDPNAPKYINTPQTALYDKSRHVFGLHVAKEAIRGSNFVVIAEGNLDVIASHQAGVKQVVATAGTALTEQHLKALSRFTGDIRLSFDADRAGVSATERAIPLASKVGVSLSIIDIPSGKDPDELVRQNPALWVETINKQKYALDWLMARYQKLLDITSAQGKREYTGVLLPVVRQLSDPVEQDHYLTAIAKTIGVSREALDAKLRATPGGGSAILRQHKPVPLPDKQTIEYTKAQDRFLALMVLQPDIRPAVRGVTADMFARAESRQLLATLQTPQGEASQPADLLNSLGDYGKILGLQYEELYQDLETAELHYEAARLRTRLVETYVKQQKKLLASQLETADDARTAELLAQVKQLDALLKRKEGDV
ncbi:MAG TPA: DNA primase [Candidatus Saccharimonadales bacterium]|nr:DNA primase [Candidatus Saccharimonadales bacterium]